MKKVQTEKEMRELLRLLEEKYERQKYHRIEMYFPDEGPFRRELYPKHVQFMNKGADFKQRAIIAANRTGKTVIGAYEMACHLTGEYPEWWEGRRFTEGVSAWAASVSTEATKNIIQKELLGSTMHIGTGMIPKDKIVKVVKKPGIADAVETVYVRHVSGDISDVSFKAYEQGPETFQGTKKQIIWLDEEPSNYKIYSESLTRTAGGAGEEGIIYCTFTPLFGLSDVVKSFLPHGKIPETGVDPDNPYKFVTQVQWEEVPHLSEQWKAETMESYSPYERAARTKGIPALGSGAIYPYIEDDFLVDPFEIPVWWPRAYGLDVGWNKTAAVWGAVDPSSKQLYLYSEHYMGKEPPAIHASAIKGRGDWVTGAVDPRADARSQTDGTRLIDLYEREGLNLIPADNSVEAGLYKIGQMFASGQIKVFKTLTNWLSEFRIYRRDERGKVIKKDDHLMDAMRYLIMTGLDYAEAMPDEDEISYGRFAGQDNRDPVTGY